MVLPLGFFSGGESRKVEMSKKIKLKKLILSPIITKMKKFSAIFDLVEMNIQYSKCNPLLSIMNVIYRQSPVKNQPVKPQSR